MASDTAQATDKREQFLEPVILLGRCLVLFVDVATLMVRLLVNTLLHDTHHGKGAELGDTAREG